ncbi:hypothetical protein [Paenibacillus sp. MMS20-IR301]|uniref:hypothetical protein n=1 Tax=Paenibacillus sp. MMS20-IR301 TaxID=2895946 RepID=UPI0028ECAFB9|nr:hypothetical protein [Paenibacillus sp. MMS20-IR301]WNS45171.1 hypothetical protein LOS79_07845 [Paenibacillus sp. MMS20-IR301]
MKRKSLIYSLLLAIIVSVVSGAGSIHAAARNITDIVKVTKPAEIKVGEWKSYEIAISDWTDADVTDHDFTPASSDENIIKVVRKTKWVSELHAISKGTATLTVNIGDKFEPYVFTVQVVDEYTVIPEPTSEPTQPVVVKEPTQAEIMLQDLSDYIDQLDLIATYEKKAITTINQYDVVNDSTRKTIFLALNNTVVPNYTKFVSGLKNIKPNNNAELKEIYNYHLAGAKLQLEGFTIMRDSLKTTKINFTKFNAGEKKAAEGIKLLNKAEALLDKFTKKYFE